MLNKLWTYFRFLRKNKDAIAITEMRAEGAATKRVMTIFFKKKEKYFLTLILLR